ncbi:MAG: acetyl-CoA carboxylase biotin carboxyl carrier protein [Xanthobacteraceae bacterium]|jgi:acetyl-CoA carboxylase biotin carboxyl carrier protein
MTLRYDDIAAILKLIEDSNCDEVSIETDEIKLYVRRGNSSGAPSPRVQTAPARPPATSAVAPVQPQPPASAPKKIGLAPGQFEITAPMVGTFYRAPSPEAPPFVEAGTVVEKGQTLCLIEVMKLFTTIYAERAGRIVQIGPNNGDLVEFGQTLFVIEARD